MGEVSIGKNAFVVGRKHDEATSHFTLTHVDTHSLSVKERLLHRSFLLAMTGTYLHPH
jgi:hypothetical protein